jgi:hypothetical protein
VPVATPVAFINDVGFYFQIIPKPPQFLEIHRAIPFWFLVGLGIIYLALLCLLFILDKKKHTSAYFYE